MFSRKRSISSLLNEDINQVPNQESKPKSKTRSKVIYNCSHCNRKLVNYRTKLLYECSDQKLPPKRQSLNLSLYKLALSSQSKHKLLESPIISQDPSKIPDTTIEDNFSFRPRVRNLVLNRTMLFTLSGF